ncbi:MAG: hypothetical protein IJJ00_07115 [Erysipelotrichaceae bacterium]|nr:hypothetical protein [Erysipelotrichaceae bacterium]
MKKIELLAHWSVGPGDSGSYPGEFEIDDDNYELLKHYVLDEGITDIYDIPNDNLRSILEDFEEKLDAEYKNVEKENWKWGLTGDRREDYKTFDDWWNNYFSRSVYSGRITISDEPFLNEKN